MGGEVGLLVGKVVGGEGIPMGTGGRVREEVGSLLKVVPGSRGTGSPDKVVITGAKF